MELGDVQILTRPDTRGWLMAHRNEDPAVLALSKKDNVNLPPVVYSQLKILKKAAKKLPHWEAAGCIFTERGLEQSSSERAAALKPWGGKRCLDLTLGLGVDAHHFSKSFDHVTGLEPDPVLFEIAKYNRGCLGADNLELFNSTAESWLEDYDGPGFDLMYVDPDRRDEQGQRKQSPAQGKPDVIALLPKLGSLAKKLIIKASPLYDIAQAGRDFPDATRLISMSVDGEVKELLIEIDFDKSEMETKFSVWCDRGGERMCYDLDKKTGGLPLIEQPPEAGYFIYEPDSAFYAARMGEALIVQEFSDLNASMNNPAGFYFSTKYTKSFPGRVFAIRESLAFKPKNLRKRFRKQALLITRRHFPFSVQHIRKQTGIADGGTLYLICTTINGEKFAFIAERMYKM